MPFLRVLRDKRGYETTYLMHWFREGSRQHSRILYMFRTPPGVRVGRDPLDPQVIREIQATYPDIEFDWRALRENQQIVESSAEPRRPRPKRRKEEEPERPGTDRVRSEAGQAPVVPPAAAPEERAVPPARLVIPAAIEGTTREEQFVFLLKLYLDLRERVPHRTHDPIRREALMGLVERLNPEAWVGEEAVVIGLEQAAVALERLSHIFAKRRKRPRRNKTERREVEPERKGELEPERELDPEPQRELELRGPSAPFEPREPSE